MKFITRPIKFVCACPFYLFATFATLVILCCARVIDWLYPESKTSVNFMRALLGFNASHVEITDTGTTRAKAMGIKIYK